MYFTFIFLLLNAAAVLCVPNLYINRDWPGAQTLTGTKQRPYSWSSVLRADVLLTPNQLGGVCVLAAEHIRTQKGADVSVVTVIQDATSKLIYLGTSTKEGLAWLKEPLGEEHWRHYALDEVIFNREQVLGREHGDKMCGELNALRLVEDTWGFEAFPKASAGIRSPMVSYDMKQEKFLPPCSINENSGPTIGCTEILRARRYHNNIEAHKNIDPDTASLDSLSLSPHGPNKRSNPSYAGPVADALERELGECEGIAKRNPHRSAGTNRKHKGGAGKHANACRAKRPRSTKEDALGRLTKQACEIINSSATTS